MEDEKQEITETEVLTPETENAETTEEITPEVEQNLLNKELEKVRSKRPARSELEKALYSKEQIERRISELQGTTNDEEDDDAPLTVGMLKKLQQQNASKTAVQLADNIPNEIERELVKFHLENTIRSTGNAEEDLNNAKSIVSAKKNELLLKEVARKGTAKTHSAGSSAPSKEDSKVIEFSEEEQAFMRPPFNLSRDDVLKARKG